MPQRMALMQASTEGPASQELLLFVNVPDPRETEGENNDRDVPVQRFEIEAVSVNR